MAPSPLGALLDGLVDYAGLFPPAALPMPAAVERYADYRRGPDRTMLGRFVVPVARLDHFVAAATPLARAEGAAAPWRLAVLASATDAATLAIFNAQHGARWMIDTVEAKADDADAVAAIAAALGRRFTVYVELALGKGFAALVGTLAAHGLRAKVRTGGIVAEAFPSAADLADFLVACHHHGVPFKATAGLHHPLRGEYALTYEPQPERGTMFGFLNVFLAATLVHGGAGARDVVPLLEERDPAAIEVTPASIRWRSHRVDATQVADARARFAGSFGSCSFEEPVHDLAALSLIPTA